ncbi:MAG: hypothetical protein JXB42_02105, partial [Deltaproteobacteria bacterium]|nr:hypothetical protein [Deltaproteobacteria bacterium]
AAGLASEYKTNNFLNSRRFPATCCGELQYNLLFSEEALTELEKLFYKTDVLIRHTRRAIEYSDDNAASITLTVDKEIDELIAQCKLNHVMRLG